MLKLAPESREVLFNGRKVHVLKTRKPVGARRTPPAAAAGEYDTRLFDRLRDLRKELAARQGVPAYVIFNDRTLHEMARFCPATEEALSGLTGVGAAKLERYGEPFLNVIREFDRTGVKP